ncbi:hypothetical protein ElyMa_000238700 [Elysia marginata]|uniref:Uncharacterized protein n=1 Tax=Elysia marginata TaxID=1093978 RepID=A0AAV4F0Z0_9GAST|nr:hypothetical protein ElyMa_000238700 [Elysia marginata]
MCSTRVHILVPTTDRKLTSHCGMMAHLPGQTHRFTAARRLQTPLNRVPVWTAGVCSEWEMATLRNLDYVGTVRLMILCQFELTQDAQSLVLSLKELNIQNVQCVHGA